MDIFLQKTPFEQRLFINEAFARTGKAPVVLEKDFWVCWILGRIFTLPDIGSHLTFKGGTSLSKAYGLIQRFSEDVDVSFHREYLGFGGENDPAAIGLSGKERERRLEELQRACIDFIGSRFVAALKSHVENALPTQAWSLEVDQSDPQAVLFHYPRVQEHVPAGYIRPLVRIELGARSDHWPVERKTIRSYLSEAFPMVLLNSGWCEVEVLAAERTFWEKATILHSEFHRPAESVIPDRQSRHYYDLARMAQSETGQRAQSQLELLRAVAEHKKIFFRSARAKYDEAKPPTLRLVPPPERIRLLEQDYAEMRDMFFETPPPFSDIIKTLSELESVINRRP